VRVRLVPAVLLLLLAAKQEIKLRLIQPLGPRA
jgi:hypothetical protein